jgi:hypothetical protein
MTDDPEKLVMVLRMAVRMRDLQKQYMETRHHVVLETARKAALEFDAAAREALE